jgi:hypothetical protein
MRLLASFVMQGRSQAVMAISIIALLSVVFPPLAIISSAGVALVTLRIGPRDGLFVVLLSAIACGLLAMLVQVNVVLVIGTTLLLWAPIWILAYTLRSRMSLAFTATIALLLGVLLIAFHYLQYSDPAAQWYKVLGPMIENLSKAQGLEAEQGKLLLSALSKWMTGMMAAGLYLQLMASLLLARWWQSLLYNPGGFKDEFHQLRLPRLLAMFAIAVVVLLSMDVRAFSPLLDYLAMLLVMAFLLQGLALAHGIRAQLDANQGWLFGMYILLIFGMHYMVILLATIGVFDALLDFRTRIGKGKQDPGGAD